MWLKKHVVLIILVAIFFSCEKEETIPSSGIADFREYVAVGNSLTAGYSDGGLYRAAQINSYPAILARQLSLNSGMKFIQPLMPEGNGSGYIKLLSYPDNGYPIINYLTPDPRAFDKVSGSFHNLGVPGIRVKDIEMQDYGTEENNEYFYRMLPAASETSTSYLDLIESSNHTFFTCWMGNNDVLGYATEGGYYGEDGYGEYERSGLTDIDEFNLKYNLLIEKLTERGARGIVLTIPDILHIPYFNLVSNDDFPNLSSIQASTLNARYSEINQLIEKYNADIENNDALNEDQKQQLYRETINFTSTDNAFVIEDKDLPNIDMMDSNGNPVPKIRHMRDGEKITVPGILEITDIQKLAGINRPLGDRYVLTANEIELIEQYREQYNQIIKNASSLTSIGLVDADALINEYKDGKTVDGVFISTEIVEGGLFSLDGIHLTQRGYALVANEIIETINEEFGAEIPRVNISGYKAVDVP